METSSLILENMSKTTLQTNGTVTESSFKQEKLSHGLVNEGLSSGTTAKDAGTGGKGTKHNSAKVSVSFEDKFKIEPDMEITELLGSVTTNNCPGVRTSARVIQKMKQDQIRPLTPPPHERDHKQKEEKAMQKTPSQVRANKPIWTNLERNHFFDAVNEFGKDFEAIGNYINTKLKRKCGTDIAFKTKDQVRQHYYQTFHKICKYIRFSDEVKKPAQELYALINYGEMRRKLQFVTDKHFIKLKNLLYQGQIIVRCKGKNIRIKTPSCKALRRLNQLDDYLEEIRLPSKIEVLVSPANMESFGRVQTIAQNPRARVTVPLQKKLINFIKTFQHKWRSSEMKFANEAAKLFPTPSAGSSCCEQNIALENPSANEKSTSAATVTYQDPEICFLPKPGVAIHRPLLSITEYLSSVNICLAAYEERIGVKVRGETLCIERPNNKRQRTESGSEKRSPDAKKLKNNIPVEKTDAATFNESLLTRDSIKEEPHNVEGDLHMLKSENSGSDCNIEDLSDELNELLNDADITKYEPKKEQTVAHIKEEPGLAVVITDVTAAPRNDMAMAILASSLAPSTQPVTTLTTHVRSKRATASKARAVLTFKPLISESVIRRIRKGWTVSNAADITIGDLYVVFGQDSRLELDYYWTELAKARNSSINTTVSSCSMQTDTLPVIFSQKQNGIPYNPSECDDPQLLKTLSKSSVSNKLKHLLLIANISERIRKRQCACGHTCERNSPKARIERGLATKTFISNKTFLPNAAASEGNNLFRQPIAPIRRPVFNMDSVKQLSTVSRHNMSRQVLVQRLLLPGGINHHELVTFKNLQNNMIGLKQDKTKLMTSAQTLSSALNNTHARPSQAHSMSDVKSLPLDVNGSPSSSGSMSPSGIGLAQDATSDNALQTELRKIGDADDIHFATQSSLPDSAFDESSNTSIFNGMSPMHIVRESTSNSRWLEENINDFSLTSLLGHLDEINASRDILDPSSNLSVISESSVDYMSKFQEITALMRSQDSD